MSAIHAFNGSRCKPLCNDDASVTLQRKHNTENVDVNCNSNAGSRSHPLANATQLDPAQISSQGADIAMMRNSVIMRAEKQWAKDFDANVAHLDFSDVFATQDIIHLPELPSLGQYAHLCYDKNRLQQDGLLDDQGRSIRSSVEAQREFTPESNTDSMCSKNTADMMENSNVSISEFSPNPSLMMSNASLFNRMDGSTIEFNQMAEFPQSGFYSTDSLNLSQIKLACLTKKQDYMLAFGGNAESQMLASHQMNGSAVDEGDYKDAYLSSGSDLAIEASGDSCVDAETTEEAATVPCEMQQHQLICTDLPGAPRKLSSLVPNTDSANSMNCKTGFGEAMAPTPSDFASTSDSVGNLVDSHAPHAADVKTTSPMHDSKPVSLMNMFKKKVFNVVERLHSHGSTGSSPRSGRSDDGIISPTSVDLEMSRHDPAADPPHAPPLDELDYEYSEYYANGRYVDMNQNELGYVPPSTQPYQHAVGNSIGSFQPPQMSDAPTSSHNRTSHSLPQPQRQAAVLSAAYQRGVSLERPAPVGFAAEFATHAEFDTCARQLPDLSFMQLPFAVPPLLPHVQAFPLQLVHETPVVSASPESFAHALFPFPVPTDVLNSCLSLLEQGDLPQLSKRFGARLGPPALFESCSDTCKLPVHRDSGLGDSSGPIGSAPQAPHIVDWESLCVLLPRNVVEAYCSSRRASPAQHKPTTLTNTYTCGATPRLSLFSDSEDGVSENIMNLSIDKAPSKFLLHNTAATRQRKSWSKRTAVSSDPTGYGSDTPMELVMECPTPRKKNVCGDQPCATCYRVRSPTIQTVGHNWTWCDCDSNTFKASQCKTCNWAALENSKFDLVSAVTDAVQRVACASREDVSSSDLLAIVNVQLCQALSAVLRDGLVEDCSLWSVVEQATGPATKSVRQLVDTISARFAENERFEAFVIGLLRLQSVDCWLAYLAHKDSLIEKCYKKTALLRLATTQLKDVFSTLIESTQSLSCLLLDLPSQIDASLDSSSGSGNGAQLSRIPRAVRTGEVKSAAARYLLNHPSVIPRDSRIPKSSSIPEKFRR